MKKNVKKLGSYTLHAQLGNVGFMVELERNKSKEMLQGTSLLFVSVEMSTR
jgi:hypothetical protein